jgi:antitoxin component YwqK of YwqJK toxin-antitoxin module
MAKEKPQRHIVYHRDGSVWAKGQTMNDVPVGYWEWFRKEGSRMRSGTFDQSGSQTGEWTTYDRNGEVHKVTYLTRKAGSKAKKAKKNAKSKAKAKTRRSARK